MTGRFQIAGRWALLLLAWSLPVSLFGMQAGAILGAAVLLSGTARTRGEHLQRTPLDRPILWLLLAQALSLLLAPRLPTSFRTATSFWVVIAFCVSFHLQDSRRTLERAVCGILLLAALASCFGLFQAFSGLYPLGTAIHQGVYPLLQPAEGSPGLFCAVGLFFSRLTFAHALLIPLSWAVALACAPIARRGRTLAGIAAGLMAIGIAFTFTRAALVAAGILTLVLVFANLRPGRARRLGLGVVAAAVAVILIGLPGVPKKLWSSFSGSRDWGRLAIWQTALDLAAEEPLTGIGYGNFQRDAAQGIEARAQEMGRRFPGVLAFAHSNPLTFLAESGALGLFGFVWLFVAFFRRARGTLRQSGDEPFLRALLQGSVAGVAAVLVVGLAHDTFFDGEVVFGLWTALGLSLAVGRLLAPAEASAPMAPASLPSDPARAEALSPIASTEDTADARERLSRPAMVLGWSRLAMHVADAALVALLAGAAALAPAPSVVRSVSALFLVAPVCLRARGFFPRALLVLGALLVVGELSLDLWAWVAALALAIPALVTAYRAGRLDPEIATALLATLLVGAAVVLFARGLLTLRSQSPMTPGSLESLVSLGFFCLFGAGLGARLSAVAESASLRARLPAFLVLAAAIALGARALWPEV